MSHVRYVSWNSFSFLSLTSRVYAGTRFHLDRKATSELPGITCECSYDLKKQVFTEAAGRLASIAAEISLIFFFQVVCFSSYCKHVYAAPWQMLILLKGYKTDVHYLNHVFGLLR